MSHLRAIETPAPEPTLSHEQGTQVFRGHLRRARAAWVALVLAQSSAFLAPLMYGETAIKGSEARIALRDAEALIQAANDLRNAIHDMSLVYEAVKPTTSKAGR